ncbi:MAG: hydrogenase formation protein HypD, partial [Anaerolineales bacterium]
MKYITEFRDAGLVKGILGEIRRIITRPWRLMEICGGQTHAIMHYGLHELLPPEIELVHGPGCPVCVTSLEQIDRALAIAARPEVIFMSYGDMLRVPGSDEDLFTVRGGGGDIRVVYSPLDAVRIAQQNPDKQVVFFAIGFETTAPANAMSVVQARALGLENYSILVSHVRVPPAMHAILGSPYNQVQAFLAAGHVCAVMGYWEYPPIAEKYQVPIVVTGFEPTDLLQGILAAVRQLESGRCETENAYERAVTFEGNRPAQKVISQVFMECDRKWRGIGNIPMSGW